MSELKPCPFCGGEAEATRSYGIASGFVFHIVECLCCWAKTSFCDTEAEAIEAWNTRYERTCHTVKGSRKYVLSDGTELFEDGCSECNGYLSDGDNFCPNCGAKVVE